MRKCRYSVFGVEYTRFFGIEKYLYRKNLFGKIYHPNSGVSIDNTYGLTILFMMLFTRYSVSIQLGL